jgi:hypothetical protein
MPDKVCKDCGFVDMGDPKKDYYVKCIKCQEAEELGFIDGDVPEFFATLCASECASEDDTVH